MNTPIAGYLVETRLFEQPNSATADKFINVDLFTARQAAFVHARSLSARKAPTDVLDVMIRLFEDDGTQNPFYIALVFNRRFHRSQLLVPAGTLTIDLSKEDEACQDLPAVQDSLGELICEDNYYKEMHIQPLTGFVYLTVEGLNRPFGYRLLYEGLTYAQELIQHYNKEYAPEGTSLTPGWTWTTNSNHIGSY